MAKNLLFLIVSLIQLNVFGAQPFYEYKINISNLKNDRIPVELLMPGLPLQHEIDFIFPVSVPGYYNTDLKFGELITDFKAIGENGKLLEVNRIASNRFRIMMANKLHKITYQVNDVWEEKDKLSRWMPAENIFHSDSVFFISHPATLGYFENFDKIPFQLELVYPTTFYPSTGFQIEQLEGKIRYKAKDYFDICDKPIFFTKTPPITTKIANTQVEISCYSPTGKISNEYLLDNIRPLLTKISSYLGDTLPADKYAFLFFFYPGEIFASAALEHHNSSVYVYPEEWNEDLLGSTFQVNLRNTVIHEFFHIIAPLNIHSEEILNFNFTTPKTSKHLWLYEGTTEYLTHHFQVCEGIISFEEYLGYLEEVIKEMGSHRTDVPLTEISKETYGRYDEEYDNLELRGLLVNLLLDIKINELSNGERNLKHLLMQLCKRFGKERAFKDNELFDILTAMTYPEIRLFLQDYLEGIKPLPLEEFFGKVGIAYNRSTNQLMAATNPTTAQVSLRQRWISN